eukprot:5354912-Prymnesium_polylepis.1
MPQPAGAEVYETTKTGKKRKSAGAALDAKSRDIAIIAAAIERVGGSDARKAQVLNRWAGGLLSPPYATLAR